MSELTDAQLKKIFPHSTARNRAIALPSINQTARAYDISNERRMAGWLATLGIESGELKYQEEIASGAAYEGRKDLGNTQKGDGRRFKGHGRIQITGRSNHASYTNYLKKNKHLPFVDFIAEPHRLAEEPYATDSAGWFWAVKVKNNPTIDAGDFHKTQIRVNGINKKTGNPNHWVERQNYYAKALSVLPDDFKLSTADTDTAIPNLNLTSENQTLDPADGSAVEKPLLKLGSKGDDVCEVQKILGVKVDGDFGKATEAAVINFQIENHLDADGKVGPETWAAFASLPPPETGVPVSAANKTDVVIEKEPDVPEEKPKGFFGGLWKKVTTALGLDVSANVAIAKAQEAQALGLSAETWRFIFWAFVGGVTIWVLYHFVVDKVIPWGRWLAGRIRTNQLVASNANADTTQVIDASKLAEYEAKGYIVIRRS